MMGKRGRPPTVREAPCRHGTLIGSCQACASAKHYALHRESVNAKTLAHYHEHRDRILPIRRTQKYGLELGWVDTQRLVQNNKCDVCEEEFGPRPRDAVIDHDHKTGAARSLLCQRCNIGLGHFLDSPEMLRKAADYLEGHNG